MTPEAVAIAQIEAQGWRQGCILPVACHVEVGQLAELEQAPEPDDACIVVTQSCDLLHHNIQQEPYVELLLARPLTGPPDSRLRNRRNPRRRHFDLSVRGQRVGYEAQAWRRCYRLPRTVLARYQPDPERCVPDELSLRLLLEWVAGRYTRSALPSVFQHRLEPVQKKLRKWVANLTEASLLFIALSSEDELHEAETYRVAVILVLPEDEYAQMAKREAMEQLLEDLRKLLKQCPGIEWNDDSQVQSEAEISLADLRSLLRWEELDYVSYQDHATHQAPYSGMR